MVNKDMSIVIAGGGLVGSLQALLLGKSGYKVDVYESRVDMRRDDIPAGRSINLALANRGIAPLEKAGVMDEVKKLLIPMKGRMIHELDGSMNFQPYGQKDDEIIYSVSRGGLNKLLLSEAEKTGNVSIEFEKRIKNVDIENRHISFKDSDESVNYDLLIGADGAGSPVRKSLMAKIGSEDRTDWLDHSYKELHIPADKDGNFQLEKEALHIWPRSDYMVIALPNPDGSFTVTLFMPNEGDISFSALDSKDKVTNFFKEQFKTAYDLIPDLAESFFANPTGKLGTVKCFPWVYEDSLCLMGDAAHAIVPFHGQGMNCGFEDCNEFTQLINGSESLKEVLSEYEDARKINGDAIADLALDNYIVMRDSVRDDRFLTKKVMGFELEQHFPDKFIPRYSRVMFHHIPYSEALRLGGIQDAILDELYDEYVEKGSINMEMAQKLISEQL